MKKLRVLFLTRKWAPAIGGMEVYSMELSKELSHRVDLTVRSLSGTKDGSPPRIGRLICFLFSSLVYLWRTRRNFDVVHFGDFVLFSLAWWHALWAPSITRIVSVHGLDLLFGNRPGWKSTLYSQFVSWAVQRQALVACFLANSRYTSTLCSELNLQKVDVIPLGIKSKKNLPAFTTSGKFSKRNANGLLDHSGIIQIDIDKVENPAELRDKLIQDKHICAAFISPSGKGVKCLLLTLADPTKHKAAFNTAENYLKDHYNVEIDKACKDVSRLCFVSYDADLRTNPDAIPLPIPEEPSKITPQRKSFPEQSESETADRLRSALQVLSAEEYGTWISHGIA